MATTKSTEANEIRLTVPTFSDVTDSVNKLTEDISSTLGSVTRRATNMLPESGRKGVDELVDRVGDVRENVEKTITQVREDVEDRVTDLRKSVDKRFAGLRKETDARRKDTVAVVEKETRKQIEKVFKRLNLPVQSDVAAVKRRLTTLERKVNRLIKELEEAA